MAGSDDASRFERRYEAGTSDFRTPTQRDRDRVLYSSAFRRLAGVTQVVGPVEGHIFHNRLTHTLEVAQIARRIAESLNASQPDLVRALDGLDADAVEAAALIHDLGHPPFGHAAESELNTLMLPGTARVAGSPAKPRPNAAPGLETPRDGFEGNPQSFRIITRLAAHRPAYPGLNLTRTTLNASLKYPHFRAATGHGNRKFGAYRDDADDFEFARRGLRGDSRTLEAEVMDYADGVAYSIHDLDDFFRAGLIPIDKFLSSRTDDFDEFIQEWKSDPDRRGVSAEEIDEHKSAILRWLQSAYSGVAAVPTWRQAAQLRAVTATQIAGLVTGVQLKERGSDGSCLILAPGRWTTLKFCQRLVWRFVIANPRLATQQHGQRMIVRTLFVAYADAMAARNLDLLPPRFRQRGEQADNDDAQRRVSADIVSSFTDAQAILLYHRLTGVSSGSVTALL